MSHSHSHSGHDHGHDHDHDHSDDITPALQSSLYEQIDFNDIVTLNESQRDAGKAIVKKTWAERLDVVPELVSDADEQLLMTVPFTAQVKLHSILLRTSPADCAPKTLHLFVNRDGLDFESATAARTVQTLALSQTSEVQEIPVRRALFSQVRRLDLFFADNFGSGNESDDDDDDDDSDGNVSRISYIGFRGEWTRLGRAPTNIIYEAAARPSDHAVRGTSVNAMDSSGEIKGPRPPPPGGD